MKLKVSQIFNQLVEQKNLQVKTVEKTAHDSLRSRLCKLFSKHKDTLTGIGYDDGSNTLSVCANFDSDSGVSTFRIDKRKQGEALEFEIVEEGTGG